MATGCSFTDDDSKRMILRAIRLLVIVDRGGRADCVVEGLGWQTAALLAVGAAISGSGLWEWLRLMSAVMARMDGGGKPRAMGTVLTGFFLRLALTLVVLYVSLKFLDGSVYARCRETHNGRFRA